MSFKWWQLFLLFLFFLSLPGFAKSDAKYAMGLGGYVPFGLSTQKTDDGQRNTMSMHPFLSLKRRWTVSKKLFLNGIFGHVIHLGEKDKYSKSTTLFIINFASIIDTDLFFHYGMGVIETKISGDGAELRVRNGNTFSSARAPSRTIASRNIIFNIGMEVLLESDFTMKVDTYTFGILSSLKRKVSYSLSLIHYF